MDRKRQLLILCLSLVLCAAGITAAWAQCNSYPNSKVSYINGNAVCAYTGWGCTECYDEGSGGSCVTTGARCKPLQDY